MLNEETPIFCILTPSLKLWSIFNPTLMKIWEIQTNIHHSGQMIFGNSFNNYDDVDDDDVVAANKV